MLQYKKISDPLLLSIGTIIGGFDMEQGPWISGGAARRLWYNIPYDSHDIDIFFPNPEQWNNADRNLDSYVNNESTKGFVNKLIKFIGFTDELSCTNSVFRSQNSTTYELLVDKRKIRVQIIKKYYGKTLEDIWQNFDFTVCKFATDGKTLVADQEALDHCEKKMIYLNKDASGLFDVKRVIKYSIYGFTPCEEICSEIIKNYKNGTMLLTQDEY